MALPVLCTVTNPKNFQQVQGSLSKAAGTSGAIIAAPGAGKSIRLQKAVVSATVMGTTGVVTIADGNGGSVIWSAIMKDTNGASYLLDFGDCGLKLSTNTALDLSVAASGGTIQVTAVGYVTGAIS
jgi:hypothetical protein